MKKAIAVCCLILQVVFIGLYIWCDDIWVFDASLPKENNYEYLKIYWEHLENNEADENESFVISVVENTRRVSILIMLVLFLAVFEGVKTNKKSFYLKFLISFAVIALLFILTIEILCRAFTPFYLKWMLILPQAVLLNLYIALILADKNLKQPQS